MYVYVVAVAKLYFMSVHIFILLKMVRGSPLSEDLRKVIINLSRSGKSGCEIAKDLKLSRNTVRNIIRYHKETGTIMINPKIGKIPKATAADIQIFRKIGKSKRRENCGELAQQWSDAAGGSFSRSTCNRTLKQMGFGFYKVKINIIHMQSYCLFEPDRKYKLFRQKKNHC